eukprot:1161044-Pelagomonas_calceolata.AAC.9
MAQPTVVATNNEHLGAHKTPAVLVAWAGLALFPHRQGCPHICLGVCMCRDERCTCKQKSTGSVHINERKDMKTGQDDTHTD